MWESSRACTQLPGLGCLVGVTARCGYTASPKISLGIFVLGKASRLLCVLWTNIALKTCRRAHDFGEEVGKEELSKLTVLYKIP